MPKSDTWPGGTGLELLPGIDSSGSCDSVLSTNSGFSDDSLEYLSAEEKACLMFLEETIDSLDTEDDSGLSNDESDQTPAAGTVASKQADLASSFSKTTTKGEQRHTARGEQTESTKHLLKKDADKHPKPSYLVPTPFVLASCTQPSSAAVQPTVTSKMRGLEPTPNISAKEVNSKASHKALKPPVALEANIVIPSKTQQHSGKAQDSSLQRGPLSYDALVYLRKNASEKKTPLCPTVDHTLESGHLPASTVKDISPAQSNISRFDRFHPEFSQSRTIPPAVPPKPKKGADSPSPKTQTAVTSSRSFSVKRTPNPEAVRQEALQKLGLIKETNETPLPASTSKALNGLGPAHSRVIKSSSSNNPTRSPSFCVTRLPAEPKSKGLHSSASFHHTTRSEQASTHNIQDNRTKTGPPNIHRDKQPSLAPSKPSTGPNSNTAVTPKPSSAVGYTYMVVPGMGADRREALRKLGLLKD